MKTTPLNARRSGLILASVAAALLAPACSSSSPDATTRRDATELTADQCHSGNGAIVGAGADDGPANPGSSYSIDAGCPGGRAMLSAISAAGDAGAAICCAIPPSLDDAACRAAGGQPIGDPGDGSRYVAGCPDAHKLLGWLSCPASGTCGEGGICCATQ